jgi:hypothetical protein
LGKEYVTMMMCGAERREQIYQNTKSVRSDDMNLEFPSLAFVSL